MYTWELFVNGFRQGSSKCTTMAPQQPADLEPFEMLSTYKNVCDEEEQEIIRMEDSKTLEAAGGGGGEEPSGPSHSPHHVSSIEISVPVRPVGPVRPPVWLNTTRQEYCSTLAAFLLLVCSMVLTIVTNAVVHEFYRPEFRGAAYDVILARVPASRWALTAVCEPILEVQVLILLVVALSHQYTTVILRRFFIHVAVLYWLRIVTETVTVLPVPQGQTTVCIPKAGLLTNETVTFGEVIVYLGKSVARYNGHGFCGDYIFSGHSMMHVIMYLFTDRYLPPGRLYRVVSGVVFVLSAVGIVFLLMAHVHYTIDVLVAYWVSTRLFWTYHTVVASPHNMKAAPDNLLTRPFWFPILQLTERGVPCPLPQVYRRRSH